MYHVNEPNARERDPGYGCGFESRHGMYASFNTMVILLKDVVEILNLQDFYHFTVPRDFQGYVDSLCSGQIGSAFINDNFVWNTVVTMALLKKRRAALDFRRSESLKSIAIPFTALDYTH